MSIQAYNAYLAGAGGGGGEPEPTIIFGPRTISAESGSWDGYTYRQQIDAGSLVDVAGDEIRVTFAAGQTGGLNIDKAYIGLRGSGFSFATTPVQLLFSASAGVLIPASGVEESDWVALVTDGTDDLVISAYITGSDETFGRASGSQADGCTGGYKFGDDAATVSVSGYNTGGTLDNAIERIRSRPG